MICFLIMGITLINFFFINSQRNFESRLINIKNQILNEYNNNIYNFPFIPLSCGSNNEFSLEVDEHNPITGCLWDNEEQDFPVSCSKVNIQNINALYDYEFNELIIYFKNSECTVSYWIDTTDDELYGPQTYQGFHSKVVHIKNLIVYSHNNDNSYGYVRLSCGSNNEFSLEVNEDNPITGCLWDNVIQKLPSSCSKVNIQNINALYDYEYEELIIYFESSECTVSYWIDTTDDELYGPQTYLEVENRCKDVLIDVPTTHFYLDHQFNEFPVICKNGYKQNTTSTLSYAKCINNSWNMNLLLAAGPCIKACGDENYIYNTHHLEEIEGDKLYLDCQSSYRKIIAEDILCVQTNYEEHKWKSGGKTLQKLLDDNENNICYKICDPLTSSNISKDVGSKRVTVGLNSCTNKIKNESCDYLCEEVNTARKPNSVVRCTEKSNGVMAWEGKAYCEKSATSGDVAVKSSILNIMIFLIGFVMYLE